MTQDLHDRLSDLTGQAVRDAAIPPPDAVVRRGRRRRHRQVLATALLVVALATAAVPSLRASLTGEAVAPAGRGQDAPVSVAGSLYGVADAAVYLTVDVTAAQREGIWARLRAAPFVHELFYESKAEAYRRFQEQFGGAPPQPSASIERVPMEAMAESFHVVLTSPDRYGELQRLLCSVDRDSHMHCQPGVDLVVETGALVRELLKGTYWPARSDVSVLLTMDVTAAQRAALEGRLRGLDGVASVSYESADQAFERLPADVRAELDQQGTAMPASFRVALDDPGQVQAFRAALCRSPRTGDCADGVAMVIDHPRGR